MATEIQTDLDLVTKAVQTLGHTHINPESLTALIDHTDEWGWHSLNEKFPGVRQAYIRVMNSFRAMFAPA